LLLNQERYENGVQFPKSRVQHKTSITINLFSRYIPELGLQNYLSMQLPDERYEDGVDMEE